MTWGDLTLTWQEREDLKAELPGWDGVSRPPQPDWFVALELAQDAQVDIYRHEDIPLIPETVAVVKTWLLIRRQAHNLAREIQDKARTMARNTHAAGTRLH